MTEKRKLSSESLQAHLLYNPIADMEYRVLATNRPRSWQRATYLFLAFLCVLPFLSMAHYALYTGMYTYQWSRFNENHYHITFGILGLLFGVNYVLTILRTLHTAADVFGRERRDKTLEMMLLTGVSARQIVLGKWVGVIRTLVPDYLYLWVLRVLLIFWGYTSAIYYSMLYKSDSFTTDMLPTVIASVPLLNVILLSLVAAISLSLEAMLVSALGMVWMTARKKTIRDRGALATLVAVTLAPIVLTFLAFYLLPHVEVETYYGWQIRPQSLGDYPFLLTLFGTLIDNTSISTAMVVKTLEGDSFYAQIPNIILGIITGLALYLLITFSALRLAERNIVNPLKVELFAWFRFRQPRKSRREPEFYEAEVV